MEHIGSLNSRLPDFISFDDAPDLLRASALTQVLGRGARIFRQSGGDETTYALSRPTSAPIDSFLSHNWSMPWTHKFVALSYNFERWRALFGTLLLQLLLVFLSGAGLLQTQLAGGGHLKSGDKLRSGVYSRFLSVPTFLILLLTMTEFRRQLGLQGQSVFLDKTCIHQSNKSVQKAGIRKLGAFLCCSKRMVVLFSNDYLTRLWTVYEFACFLTFHPTGDIDLVSVSQTIYFLAGLVPIYLADLLYMLMASTSSLQPAAVIIVAVFCMAPGIGSVQRAAARQMDSYHRQVDDFTVQTCLCACEDDRPLVYHNVAELMRLTGVVSSSAAQEEALAAFDHFARTKLPQLIREARGRYGLRYSTYCIPSIFIAIPYYFDSCVQLFYGMLWKEFAALTSIYFMQCFVVVPGILALSAVLEGRNLHLHATCEKLYILGCSWLVAVMGLACIFGQEQLWALANFEFEGQAGLPRALWMAVIIVLMVVGIATAAWVFEVHQVFGNAKQRLASLRSCPSYRVGSATKEKKDEEKETPLDVREGDFLDPSQWEHVSLGS